MRVVSITSMLTFILLIGSGSLLAGFLGALTGLGGGIVIVPLLTILFHVNIRYAIGASLVSVIATSSGAASAYVKEGYTNMRIGMFLEIATTIGALVGAFLAMYIGTNVIAIIFGIVLLYSSWQTLNPRPALQPGVDKPNRIAEMLRMGSTYPTPDGPQAYIVQGVPQGFSMMFGAGVLSALLGIGSGAVKVIAMDQAMRIPFKVSTTTSNFMIGVTAAASAGVYLHRGYIDPALAMPVMLGVLMGSLAGARILPHTRTKKLRQVFAVVLVVLALEMLYHGAFGGQIG